MSATQLEAEERQILMSTGMANSVLLGLKTQTRRVIDFDRVGNTLGADRSCYGADGYDAVTDTSIVRTPWNTHSINNYLRCPFGVPGDRLWVRETHWISECGQYLAVPPKYGDPRDVIHDVWAIDGSRCWRSFSEQGDTQVHSWNNLGRRLRSGRWEQVFEQRFGDSLRATFRRRRPSLHMPRWASRLTLEITCIRGERLQTISHEDVLAEGIDRCNSSSRIIALERFERLWDGMYPAAGSNWESNPWVWAIRFRPVFEMGSSLNAAA